jgi:hypothetical protein
MPSRRRPWCSRASTSEPVAPAALGDAEHIGCGVTERDVGGIGYDVPSARLATNQQPTMSPTTVGERERAKVPVPNVPLD